MATRDHLQRGQIFPHVVTDFLSHFQLKMCPQEAAVAVQGLMCSRQIEQGPDQSRSWRSTVGYWRR